MIISPYGSSRFTNLVRRVCGDPRWWLGGALGLTVLWWLGYAVDASGIFSVPHAPNSPFGATTLGGAAVAAGAGGLSGVPGLGPEGPATEPPEGGEPDGEPTDGAEDQPGDGDDEATDDEATDEDPPEEDDPAEEEAEPDRPPAPREGRGKEKEPFWMPKPGEMWSERGLRRTERWTMRGKSDMGRLGRTLVATPVIAVLGIGVYAEDGLRNNWAFAVIGRTFG